jgi:hypothetical protein
MEITPDLHRLLSIGYVCLAAIGCRRDDRSQVLHPFSARAIAWPWAEGRPQASSRSSTTGSTTAPASGIAPRRVRISPANVMKSRVMSRERGQLTDRLWRGEAAMAD